MKTCSQCPEKHYAKGFCCKHYNQQYARTYKLSPAQKLRRATDPRKAIYAATYYRRHQPREQAKARAQQHTARLKKHNLTPEAYAEMLRRQKGCCAICGKPQQKRAMAIDHCHKTKRVRGLLCDTCNRGLGMFHDDPVCLAKAIEYLGS